MDVLKLNELIVEGGHVFNCTTPEEAHELSKMIEHLYPGRGKGFAQLGKNAGTSAYPSGIAFRMELVDGVFEWGFSDPDWYESEDYKVVSFCNLVNLDFGEINVDVNDVCDLLFGG